MVDAVRAITVTRPAAAIANTQAVRAISNPQGPAGSPGVAPLTTKGDLLTHDGAAVTVIGVGTDGQLLSADSAQAEGLAWIDPPAADPLTTAA